jgi:hypothetical protein
MRTRFLCLLSAAIAGSFLGAASASANTIQAVESGAGVSGPNFIYNYSIQLTPNNGLSGTANLNQSGLVILDFPGALSVALSTSAGDITSVANWGVGIATAGGLSGSGQTLGNTSWAAIPAPGQFTLTGFSVVTTIDSPTINNIVLVYNGPLLAPVAGPTNTTLIHLSVTSNVALNTILQSVSRNTTAAIPNEVNTYPVVTTAVPLPAAAWAGLMTLGGMGALSLLRKRKA